jgi:hypothetical protein
VALDDELSGTHKRARAEGERQKQHGRRKGNGREPPPPSALDKADPTWIAVAISGDRRMCALRRERGYRAMTGSVASGMGAVTGARGWKPACGCHRFESS